jgi:hypothetical protein
MGQYADLPAENPNPTREIIVYRNPVEKEMWERIMNGERPPAGLVGVWCFMAFFFCFIFSKVFIGIAAGPFIKFDRKWSDNHDKLERFTSIAGLVLGLIASILVWFYS